MLSKASEPIQVLYQKDTKPFFKVGSLGLAVVLMSLTLVFVFPMRVSKLPDGFYTPIIAFEFIQTKEEVNALFGPSGSHIYKETVRRMDIGNRLDYIYMILYGSFLIAYSLKVYRLDGKIWYLLGMVTALTVLAGDMLENIQLLGITARLPEGVFDQQLKKLHVFTWQKWGGIVVTFLILMPFFIKNMGYLGKAISCATVLSLGLCVISLLFRGTANELFSLSIMVIFLMTIISCFVYKIDHASRPQ